MVICWFVDTVFETFRTLRIYQGHTQGQKRGKGRTEVTETEPNEDMAKTKIEDIERGIRSEREAGKNLHEGETFKVYVHFSQVTTERTREK